MTTKLKRKCFGCFPLCKKTLLSIILVFYGVVFYQGCNFRPVLDQNKHKFDILTPKKQYVEFKNEAELMLIYE